MAADKKRGRQTVRDMVISLAVIVLAAWVIYLFVPHDEDKDPVKTVSYGIELKSARRAAPYPVAGPVGLSKDWRATSVRYEAAGRAKDADGSAWHLGFVTPRDEYAAVEQSDEPRADRYISRVTHSAKKTGKTERLGGEEWVRYTGGKYDALVLKASGEGEPTTVVTGTASFKELSRLADSLEARKEKVPAPTQSPTGK
ncbi:DUF4245 domain-containing protein [Streptomyces albiaxialis]|uniref:DUF4245 domain-containing protein n=1 Tax=Streptomyces albiaxialis TaxID=329523 RepID=A0ABP5HGA2_9ACTN